jgi:hypothetical protein
LEHTSTVDGYGHDVGGARVSVCSTNSPRHGVTVSGKSSPHEQGARLVRVDKSSCRTNGARWTPTSNRFNYRIYILSRNAGLAPGRRPALVGGDIPAAHDIDTGAALRPLVALRTGILLLGWHVGDCNPASLAGATRRSSSPRTSGRSSRARGARGARRSLGCRFSFRVAAGEPQKGSDNKSQRRDEKGVLLLSCKHVHPTFRVYSDSPVVDCQQKVCDLSKTCYIR